MLDGKAVTPLYVQLMTEIEAKIMKGVYQPGERLQSESEMAKTFGVSIITVSALVDKGLVEKKQGKGTFVSKPKFTKDIKKLQSFTEMCEHMGMKSGGRMLENKLIVADEKTRNLLGLVYFETGEVVAALSEWVISKNLQPTRNLASEYIGRLQANGNKLKAINDTIRKYNHALLLCREGHEDMASIQLRRILSQNPKLIKGYHLLALIQIKNGEWSRARRTLRKAAKIDKTNTTTLRFLREVDEQTGVTTRLEKQKKGFFRDNKNKNMEYDPAESEYTVQTPVYHERSRLPVFLLIMSGMAAGAVAFWLLAVPAIKQGIYQEANQQIVQYSESLATQGAELTKVQGEAEESDNTAETVSKQLTEEQAKSKSYESLLTAYTFYQQQNLDEAAVAVKNVQVDVLPESLKPIYITIRDATGVAGIGDPEQPQTEESSGGESSGDSGSTEGSTDDSGYDDSGYYDDGSYDDGSYDESGYYDDGYYDDGSYDDGSYYE